MKKFTRNRIDIFKLIVLLCTTSCLFLSCSNSRKTYLARDIEAKAFIDFYRKEYIETDSIVIIKNSPNKNLENCLLSLKNNPTNNNLLKANFSLSDTTVKIIWNAKSMTNATLIDSTNIQNISQYKEWLHFKEKFGTSYYAFAQPIISNDLKSVLFYSEFYCGERCGYRRLGLYTKTKAGWKLIKYYCSLVS
jgi:hypothetical protein